MGKANKTVFGIAAAVVFAASAAYASPFLVCDPYPPSDLQPDYFWVKMDSASQVKSIPVDATGGKILKYDLADITAGGHTVEVKACQASDAWGEVCSSPAVFTFKRPSVPPTPALKLTR